MAQTKKKRRRKHRGTQGGRIDRRPARGRPRSRAEAQARARGRGGKKKTSGGPRVPDAPSWSSAFKKGGIAAILFVVLLTLFGQSPLATVAVGFLMLGFYVPMAYMLDRFLYQRYLRKEAQKRAERDEQRGARQTGG
ncbi:MAG TPA: hypothetical protein VGE91_09840 [Solirubrobacterales bacterium]|jgi:hypothetical protein